MSKPTSSHAYFVPMPEGRGLVISPERNSEQMQQMDYAAQELIPIRTVENVTFYETFLRVEGDSIPVKLIEPLSIWFSAQAMRFSDEKLPQDVKEILNHG